MPMYKRVLDLFEAESIPTLFGVPNPNFVHLCLKAEHRGWTAVSPHHKAATGSIVEAASRILRTGWVSIDGAFDFYAPFGGYKRSGNGREWSAEGSAEYLEVKSLLGYRPV